MTPPKTPLVSVKWLNDHLNSNQLVILDASIYADRSVPFIENQECIPTARFLDFRKDFIDETSSLPNTIPSVEKFEENAQKLGINKQSVIVIYDNRGIYTSPRAWWLFKSMGHNSVFVLNGGLPAWKNAQFDLSFLKTRAAIRGNFLAAYQEDKIYSYEEVLDSLDHPEHCILDARSEGRFNGVEAEPRPELKSGRIPNSLNLPYVKVLKNGFYRSPQELKRLFSDLNITTDRLVFSCGSGVTACIILLAAELVLSNKKTLYDGSWTEWATEQKLFIA